MAAPDRLILYTRYPEAGRTKTRLVPVLGPQGAAEFQKRLSEHAFRAAREARERRGAALEVGFEGGDEDRMRAWLGPGADYRPQGDGDIGRRMERSLLAAVAGGAERVVLFGSDIPALGARHLSAAFERLAACDLVFGPATDGGYYLVGATGRAVRRGTPHLGPGMPWGTDRVLAATLKRARAEGFTCALLDPLEDVDRPRDLPHALAALCRHPPGLLTVVIPALDEEGHLPRALQSCRAEGVEVVVVDGGSTDRTAEIAARAGARLLRSDPPRSVQMNAGAAAGSGGTLLFLHADTRLPAGFAHQVRQVLARPGVAGGAFRLRIDGRGAGLRLVECVANWRSRWLQLPYGDQALFLERDRFWKLGGFPALPIMEDFEFMRRLRREGRIVLAEGDAGTSARRWRRLGVGRTWLVNQGVIGAFYLGVRPQRLARWYRGPKVER
jgi:rSAM/selenodomain-associated transferase 2/rSAM/selenodomain-associated transferase 1